MILPIICPIIVIDEDGNWIASFILGPKENKDVHLLGNVLIWTTPRTDFKESSPVDNHLASNKYWEVDDNLIIDAGKSLKSPLDVYSYVVKSLTYDYSRVGSENKRMGAAEILKNPAAAICMEYTDLFITLSRRIGIPAREVNGYAYTQDEFLKPLSLVADVLHAWPEYWNGESKQWIPVDPTWGSTTGGIDYFENLDFNHFVFARHGISSTYPPAAGSYKITGDEKDVLVKPEAELPVIPNSEVKAIFDIPKAMFAGESQKIMLTLTNTGGSARYNIPVSITGEDFTVEFPQNTINLPPYSNINIEGTIKPDDKIWGDAKVIASAGDTREDITINVAPKQALKLPVIILVFILLLTLLIYLVKTKHVKKRRI
ncbi:hypothetical protein HYT02_00660 [Candidatus Gottesmanbacteria bacterium]|nr:hypothetical protein [Candidatus Gottesmanbacteria bacterium]